MFLLYTRYIRIKQIDIKLYNKIKVKNYTMTYFDVRTYGINTEIPISFVLFMKMLGNK